MHIGFKGCDDAEDSGEKQNALDWLEKAYNDRVFQVLFVKTFPPWASLRNEPRYQALLKNMRLTE